MTPPPRGEHFDIVYACSSVQYIEDYQALLGRFSSYAPKYILICKTAIYAGPQFVRAQTNVGGRIPTWVFNLSNIDATLPDYDRNYCAKADDLFAVDNYSEEARVPWTTNILYVRRDE